MGEPMTDQDTKKAAALRLLKRGLVNQSEAAALAGVSRQLMRYWSKGLDCEEMRALHLSKIWSRALGKTARK